MLTSGMQAEQHETSIMQANHSSRLAINAQKTILHILQRHMAVQDLLSCTCNPRLHMHDGPLLEVVEEEPQKEVDEDDVGEDRQPAQGISPQETDSCQGCGVQQSATASHQYKTGIRMSEPRHWLGYAVAYFAPAFTALPTRLLLASF